MAMDENQCISLLRELILLPGETEWIEFKQNNSDPSMIGEYISCLSNSAAIHEKQMGYIVWGVENTTHKIDGTSFKPRQEKVNCQEL